AGHVEAHPVADLLELQALLPRPAAGPPRAADDGPVVRLAATPRLVRQGAAPGALGLEGVIDHHARVAAQGLAGGAPGLFPQAPLLLGALRQALGGQEGVRVGRDWARLAGAVQPQAAPRRQLLARRNLPAGAGVVQLHLPLEDVDLGLAAGPDLEAELGP